MDAFEIREAHQIAQIEDGPFSEDFIVDPDGVATPFKGVYDRSYLTDKTDQGNVRSQTTKPRILVHTVPSGIVWRSTKIKVVRLNETYVAHKEDIDENGIPVIWLSKDN